MKVIFKNEASDLRIFLCKPTGPGNPVDAAQA